MRAMLLAGALVVVAMSAGCGSSEPEKEEEPMKVEDTAFGPLIGTQDKARDRSNAAVEVHRKSLEKRLEEGEGAPREEEPSEN